MKWLNKRLSIIVLLNFVVICLLFGCSAKKQAAITVENAVMGQLPPGQEVGAVYLRISNNTKEDVVLNYVHSPIAADVEVHRNIYQDGVMQMRPVKHVRVAANQSLLFEPGGYHLMLVGVESKLEVGDHFDLTMEFEGGKIVNTKVEVKSPGL